MELLLIFLPTMKTISFSFWISRRIFEFIPLSFWYDAPLISRDSDRRHDPWLVYGSPSCSPAR